ncbi:MAG TPA: histidine kinase [Micromonosporaceae bacterium]|nr:histidine kinase [Micromonosporaceae bacterium]
MSARAALAPLITPSTYRRAVFLLLGGVLLLPYLLLGVIFGSMLRDAVTPRPIVLVLLAIAAVIAAVPVFLGGSRALEIAAARALLDVRLPDPVPGHKLDRETRLRSALWIAVHLVTGGVVMFALISAFPMALVFVIQRLGLGADALPGLRIGPFDQDDRGWLALAGLVTLIALGYAVAGLGALARSMAPVLLGPSPAERIAALEERAGRLAERNRLARELHDSVGHALTVVTVQAGAAGELLDADREFVRRALRAIEETGRAAMAELDHVLGLLREPEAGAPYGPRSPRPTLADLDGLVAEVRAAGQPVTVEVGAGVADLPPTLSREGYRIVQEALTNAVRHAPRQPVSVRVGVPNGVLDIEVINPVAAHGPGRGAAPGRVGRGLAGIRERVTTLGGRVSVGAEDGRWRMAVRLPTGAERQV